MPPDPDLLRRAALVYAAKDCHVFPCAANGKRPLVKNGYQDASTDAAQVEAWWDKWPAANIGLACGPSGYIALDADLAKMDDAARALLAELLEDYPTATQHTPTGGMHLLYSLPPAAELSNSPGALPRGIDVRVNGYILLAPSVVTYHGDDAIAKGVPDGHTGSYAWLPARKPTQLPPQPLPEHILALLKSKPESKADSKPMTTGSPRGAQPIANGYVYANGNSNGIEPYARAALDRELDALARAPVGERNEQLNKSTFALAQLVAGGALPEGMVTQMLGDTALAVGLEERETARTIASGMRAGAQKPRGVPETPRLVFKRRRDAVPEADDAPTAEPAADAKPGPVTKIQTALEKLGYTFQQNELRDRIELAAGVPLHDGEQATIIAQLYEQGIKNKSLILDVILADAWANRYDPLREFLARLQWDGTDYIELLSGWFLCKNDPLTMPDGSMKSVIAVWLRHWLIGAVGKALDGVQNPMLVLAGNQGIGKSEFAKWLCSPLPDYFVSSPIIPDNTDHLRWLAGNFIWEVAELGATTRKADIEGLKAFLTRPECTYRVPYAKNEVHRSARASFIGTINLDNAGFLMDATGNRRFLSAELLSIQWENYTRNIDPIQLWAQAVRLYAEDHNAWKLSRAEEIARDAINESYGAEDPILDALENLFEIVAEAEPDESPFMPTADIVSLLANSVHEPTTRQLQMNIAKALRRLNVTKGRQGGAHGIRGYWGMKRRFASRAN